jgi:hypothetical protein
MEKFGIWALILLGFFLFRLLRWLLRGETGKALSARVQSTARMNAAAKRILQSQGTPQNERPQPAQQSGGKQKYRQYHTPRKASAGPSAASARARPSAVIRLSTPSTGPAVQRRR